MTRGFQSSAKKIVARLRKQGVAVTLGGEPSYVPNDPVGAEWNVTAIGPTKLRYAYELAEKLISAALPGAIAFFSPGKSYPGETNPRWAVHLLWNRDGSAVAKLPRSCEKAPSAKALGVYRTELATRLKIPARWMRARDPHQPSRSVWVLPLDHVGRKWITAKWPFRGAIPLTPAVGPAGLRLPMNDLPPDALRRALVIEESDGHLHVFVPPLLQKPFIALLRHVTTALDLAGAPVPRFQGYVPPDSQRIWSSLTLTPDPGVLEVNLPPCASAAEYADWLERLEQAARAVGLRSFKQPTPEITIGTGGGNHLIFGGPTLERNPFFTNPRAITSILRYWQRHPSLSYLFTGDYVGPASQAPRPDESSRELYDLEMAYRFLEKLKAGEDHRAIISETLRHLHTDGTGNTHRSEISFDKFWNVAWEGGCRGLIEFRAIETMPRAEWMSAVALLWHALAAWLFEKPFAAPLIDHGSQLHDRFFLPSPLWEDLGEVLADLARAGFDLPRETYRAIWEWRFPQVLAFSSDQAVLSVRKAHEGWPLLCETPLEGGTTSRYVDTSMERLEFTANRAFAEAHRVFVQGRELAFGMLLEKSGVGAGLRYRRTALSPSLHPGIAPHLPLMVAIQSSRDTQLFSLEEDRRYFQRNEATPPRILRRPCQKLRPDLVTYDLRLE